ncbi:RidA family protein [Flavobacteriaceae bacterium]|nr:RidA family protein [Flavobacteriaceae bacterium]MDA8644082.1 RidA family protein [Flavobacteriaceae bacterium]MDA8877411.1 RidA family protein [Flavobacteriaceae bacterium]MDA9037498.1 RidA family protein [Flavobacteriaceae bacterium]MDA9851560.1 RidA family protein [Flavobacteriaceae bacterium]
MKLNEQRRSSLKKIAYAVTGIFGLNVVKAAENNTSKKIVGTVVEDQNIPLFSGAVKHGNTLYIAGKGAHFEGDIKSHTDHVLKELEKELVRNGSSMEQVLKVNVYLADLADYKGMNEVFRGRFGDSPPVRTTVATYGGVPGNSLVEMDCIAAINS